MPDLSPLVIEVEGLSSLPVEAFSEVFPYDLVDHGLTCLHHRLLDDSEGSELVTTPCTGKDVFVIGRIIAVNSDDCIAC